MKKKIRLGTLAIIYCVIFMLCSPVAASSKFIPTENLSLENFSFFKDFNKVDKELLEKRTSVSSIIINARKLGYDDDSEIIQVAKSEWNNANDLRKLNNSKLETWNQKFKEFPYATYLWWYLTDTLEYNHWVAAGIIGNVMAEVGGGTLDIQYWLYSGKWNYFYGMCQWNKKDYPEIRGADLIEQCNFLADGIEFEMNEFGCGYGPFLATSDAKTAALRFAKGYERCGSDSYEIRQNYAMTAYKYFTQGLY